MHFSSDRIRNLNQIFIYFWVREKKNAISPILLNLPVHDNKIYNSDGSTVTAMKSETNAVSSESIISQCPKCPCHQESTPKYTVHTEEDLDKRIREIKKELTIKKADLSAYRRMKTSAEDGRISAKGIGFVGVIILCSVASFIIIMDFPILAHQTVVLWRNTCGRSVRVVRRCVRGDP